MVCRRFAALDCAACCCDWHSPAQGNTSLIQQYDWIRTDELSNWKKKKRFSERILTKLDILFVKALWMNSNPKTLQCYHQRSESRLGIRASRVIRQLHVGQQFSQLWVIWGFWNDSPSCLLEPTLRAGEMNTTNRAWSTGSIHQVDVETEHLAGCLSTKSWCNLWVLQLYYVRRSTGGKTLLL